MNAENLNLLFEEPVPASSIRSAGSIEPQLLSPRDIEPGTLLCGKYRVERCLGEGAMGIVFAARHLGLDELVAIKLIRPDVQDVEGTLARFAREAKLAARIHSAHVAKVFDVGVIDPLGPFIVMEYLEGLSLAEMLEAEGPLPAARVVGYLLQACEALAAVHAAGVVHHDVKPDNLFVTCRAGVEMVCLLDFGIARQLPEPVPAEAGAAKAGAAVLLGSPLYMAPEQLRSDANTDGRTDIWALGVVAYELLSGDVPFGGTSLPEICATILDADPPALPGSCPRALLEIVTRCLAKEPTQRFESVAALAAALLPLAGRDAHAYASRASSILRATSGLTPEAVPSSRSIEAFASSPNAPPLSGGATLTIGNALDAEDDASAATFGPRAPEPATWRPAPAKRFSGSSLVASATIVALAALGVAAGWSRGAADAPPVTLQRVADRAEPAVHALTANEWVGRQGADEERDEVALVMATERTLVSAPLGSAAPATPARELDQAPMSSVSPSSAALPLAAYAEATPVAPNAGMRAPARATRGHTRRASAKQEGSGGARPRSATRVRLVGPRARPRLVDRHEPESAERVR